MGDDASLIYQGSYKHSDGRFGATVQTSRYWHDHSSLFGLDNATMSFAGTIIRGHAVGFGTSVDAPCINA
jgi:hypothetical protein